MDFSWRNIFSSGEELYDNDIRDVTIHWHNGTAYLFGTTGYHGGLFSYRLGVNGAALADTAHFNAARGAAATGTLEVFRQHGEDYLLYGTSGDDNLARVQVQADGGLGAFSTPGGFAGFGTGAIGQVADLGGGEAGLYTIETRTGTLWAHDLNTSQSRLVGTDLGPGAQLLHIGSQGGDFVVVGDMNRGDLISYRIGSDPEDLTEAARLGATEGLSVSAPNALAAITAYGSDWIVVGGAGNNALAVVKVGASGFLHTTDLVMDTRVTRFADVSSLELIEVNGQVFVFAAGSDDGFSVFSLLPNGRLVLRDTLFHDTGLGLENVQDIEAVQIGDKLHVYVVSTTSDGLAWLTVDVGDVMAPVTAAAGAHSVSGTPGDDVLLGSGTGADTLVGGAGDDVLVTGAEGGHLTGGAGADIFVVGQAGTAIRITDFELGVDRLDLSALPFLYDPAAIGFVLSGETVILSHQETTVTLSFASVPGDDIKIGDLFPKGVFEDPDRIPILSFDPGLFLEGGHGAESLLGGGFADTLMGGGGNDTINGDGGSDLIEGGSGSDQASGGDGDDTLAGGAGNDTLRGDMGDDSLLGGDGVDTLAGDDGDDTVSGGDGNDSLDGGLGGDMLDGQAGSDVIVGGRGEDTIHGGVGDDDIHGDGGHDVIYGGSGSDVLRGGREEDTIYGEEDDDIIRGQRHADTIYGGAGDDNIKGGGGNDWLAGGDGNDFVKGGTRSDVLLGGQGDDRMFGNAFNDTLDGGKGNDLLNAGGDDDRLIGGRGNDTLKGGDGADTFVFASNMGRDRILDFDPGQDVLELDGNLLDGATTAAQVVTRFGEIEAGTAVLDFGGGNVIALTGITSLDGLADDILIV